MTRSRVGCQTARPAAMNALSDPAANHRRSASSPAARQLGQVEDVLADRDAHAWQLATLGEDAVRQVVDSETAALGHGNPGVHDPQRSPSARVSTSRGASPSVVSPAAASGRCGTARTAAAPRHVLLGTRGVLTGVGVLGALVRVRVVILVDVLVTRAPTCWMPSGRVFGSVMPSGACRTGGLGSRPAHEPDVGRQRGRRREGYGLDVLGSSGASSITTGVSGSAAACRGAGTDSREGSCATAGAGSWARSPARACAGSWSGSPADSPAGSLAGSGSAARPRRPGAGGRSMPAPAERLGGAGRASTDTASGTGSGRSRGRAQLAYGQARTGACHRARGREDWSTIAVTGSVGSGADGRSLVTYRRPQAQRLLDHGRARARRRSPGWPRARRRRRRTPRRATAGRSRVNGALDAGRAGAGDEQQQQEPAERSRDPPGAARGQDGQDDHDDQAIDHRRGTGTPGGGRRRPGSRAPRRSSYDSTNVAVASATTPRPPSAVRNRR